MANMRISGLASGMDIDSIVSDMMKIKRIPLDKLNQQKQILEWQRDDYRSMNTLLDNLDRAIFDNVSLQKNFIAKKVTSSNDSAVSAVAINSQANVSNKIDVVKLAEAASWKATDDIKTSGNFTVSAEDGSVKVKTDTTLKFKVKDPGATVYREVSIEIKTDDSIDSVISKFNNSELGVSAMRAKIDIGSGVYEDRVIFSSNKTGSGGELITADTTTATNEFLGDLGFAAAKGKVGEYTLVQDQSGQDAELKINGYLTKQSSNTFTLNGIQYTLKKKTDVDNPAIISTTTDVDTVFNSVKTFVDKYNEVIEKIQGELKEERYRSYQPLSNKEKEAMSDKQVELWEEKARSGLLRNDSILSSALNTMRMDLYSTVGGLTSDFNHLSDIGIKTSSNYRDGGKLIIDESKLKEAINKDPNAVYKLFANEGTSKETKGLARRLRDSIKSSMESLVEKAGSSTKTNSQFTIGRLLTSVNSQIDRYEERMSDLETRYYKQFSAMEKMIQKANSQSTSLMQYFS
ncbi:flagellar hook-associated protein 2 [Bacillus benzoevorans]|uniref:Flagellar hook-associated protein 2 n=1 Tax=Bacillus benzoevorans TaxID=1456 RepID=A0A7X0HQL7_9BACI|nr:flagellar hook-associated protein 2 [Bacillus benzoevorans]MBB6445132.1 flagellar hook-associated protein 2 [Bacillus benzoevorans]